jgi:hypothetical protein
MVIHSCLKTVTSELITAAIEGYEDKERLIADQIAELPQMLGAGDGPLPPRERHSQAQLESMPALFHYHHEHHPAFFPPT